jgi:hypothetical protein
MMPDEPQERIDYFKNVVGSHINLQVNQFGCPKNVSGILQDVSYGHLGVNGHKIHVQSVEKHLTV